MQRSSSNVSLILPSIFHASFTTHNTFISASQVAQWERIPCSAGDLGSIPRSGRCPGEGNGNHSSILAWRIPWTEEPGELQSMGLQRVGREETQAGIKIAGRNINNLRYADDTTIMAESEELNSLLMKVKEESEKAGLKFNIQKTKIMASGPITSWQMDGETMETERDFIFLGSKITTDGDCSKKI